MSTTLTDERLAEFEKKLDGGEKVPAELAREILQELTELKRRTAATGEASDYVAEIQRLNGVVQQLIEYIDTIAEIVEDSFDNSEVPTEIKRRAVQMIIQSVSAIRPSSD